MKSFYFRYDTQNIEQVIDHLEKKYVESEDFIRYESPGDFVPNSIDVDLNVLSKDAKLVSLLMNCDGIEL